MQKAMKSPSTMLNLLLKINTKVHLISQNSEFSSEIEKEIYTLLKIFKLLLLNRELKKMDACNLTSDCLTGRLVEK